ncbi:MAG TPA: serine/threonine-protein kinase [Gemmatimonadaceae bacterium]|nr:serine/threonine-protein kinase [Gemmatimonadaceae bacterium]
MGDPVGGEFASHIARSLASRYRIERELGRGGMATVLLAEDLKHGRAVAIKVLHEELGAWLGAERFLSEIRITARLQHPHILPLLDSGDAGSALYYVMPYVSGETLRARLRREKQLPVAEAVRIGKEVATALAYAHAGGVIHRDIKPENILLGAPNAGAPAPTLLADFGIARSLDSSADRLTSTGITVGTPSYMSPEQATGEREIDARSDVYSLASVIYEMLAGEPPFSGANPRAILSKQLADPVRPVRRLRDGVPKHLDDALAVALGRSPADRFPDMASFAAALEEGGSAPAPRRRRLARLAAVVVVLGGGATTWATFVRPKAALGMPSVRIERFTTAAGDTASAYLAATLKQDVTAALAGSRAARVFVMDSARLSSGYAVSATAARTADSVEVTLSVTVEPTGEFKGQQIVRRPLRRAHELPEAATDAILAIVGIPRAALRSGRPPTTDSIAYDLYLRGRFQTDRRTEAATQRAVALFRAAVQRDSNFAEGWAGLARALQRAKLRRYRIPDIPADRVLSMMIDASDRALDADSTRSYVWIARALTLEELEPSSRRGALLASQKAIALDSDNADAWHFAGVAWDDSLEPTRAVASWRRAIRIDPTHRQALGFLAQHYTWMRQYDSALFWADSGRRIDPAYYFARQMLALVYLSRHDTLAAAENFRAAIQLGKGPDEVIGWVGLTEIALQGRNRRAADTLFAHALALADTLHPTVHDAPYVAWGYVTFGDTTHALQLLERFDPRADSHFQLHLHCDPGLDPLRASPRFKALLVRPTAACLR